MDMDTPGLALPSTVTVRRNPAASPPNGVPTSSLMVSRWDFSSSKADVEELGSLSSGQGQGQGLKIVDSGEHEELTLADLASSRGIDVGSNSSQQGHIITAGVDNRYYLEGGTSLVSWDPTGAARRAARRLDHPTTASLQRQQRLLSESGAPLLAVADANKVPQYTIKGKPDAGVATRPTVARKLSMRYGDEINNQSILMDVDTSLIRSPPLAYSSSGGYETSRTSHLSPGARTSVRPDDSGLEDDITRLEETLLEYLHHHP